MMRVGLPRSPCCRWGEWRSGHWTRIVRRCFELPSVFCVRVAIRGDGHVFVPSVARGPSRWRQRRGPSAALTEPKLGEPPFGVGRIGGAVIYKSGMKNGIVSKRPRRQGHRQAVCILPKVSRWLGTPRFIRIDRHAGPAERASDSPAVSSVREFGSRVAGDVGHVCLRQIHAPSVSAGGIADVGSDKIMPVVFAC